MSRLTVMRHLVRGRNFREFGKAGRERGKGEREGSKDDTEGVSVTRERQGVGQECDGGDRERGMSILRVGCRLSARGVDRAHDRTDRDRDVAPARENYPIATPSTVPEVGTLGCTWGKEGTTW